MRNLDLDLLRTFVTIAEKETFAVAAQHVHRTQSAVTQQMQRLETQLGVKLFARAGRGKNLTEHGVRLLDYARRILALHDEACRSLTAEELEGPVRIGAPHDVADTILPNLLARFSKTYPKLRMDIHVGRSPYLMEALKRGDIELTLSTREDPTLAHVTLRTSPTVWVCAADYVFDRSQPVPLVLADGPSLFRRLALEALDQAGIAWRQAYVSPTLAGIRAAVRAGLGVTARSIEMLTPELKVLGEADGLPRLPDVDFHLYLGDHTTSVAARRLFEALAQPRPVI